jgi:2-polyprenyl-3-methyl-5-hydroxy-6-metoxy-1,4-benzoquinol methylase
MKRYYFEEITKCEMCGDNADKHPALGQRLNQSQGLSPKQKTGIAVSIKKCTNCELIYSSPQPIPFDIQDHYGTPPEEYWAQGYHNWTDDPNYFLTEINIAKKLLPFKEGMTALDVGAGLGKCMIALNNAGFDAYGFEPSTPFYERAISKMNIDPGKIKHGKIEDIDYPDNSFDLILFTSVLEHVYHPAASLEKAMKWLKPNGIIFIEVPSSKHLIARLINSYYKLRGTNYVTHLSPMHPPFHLYEFGLKSFEALGKKINYNIAAHYYYVCEISFVPKFLHPIFRKYMESTNTGLELAVYLRK